MTRSRKRGRPPHDDLLTPGEWRITNAVRHGMSNAAIARRRGISRDAVKFHLANILGKLGLAGRAELRHWHGQPKMLAFAAKEVLMSATADNSFGALGQIARSVADIETAERWYRDVLGLSHLYTFGQLAFFDCAGVRLMLSADTEGGSPQVAILYFRVADIARSYHADGTEEWMAFFSDNEGRPLAIMSQVRRD